MLPVVDDDEVISLLLLRNATAGKASGTENKGWRLKADDDDDEKAVNGGDYYGRD